MKGQVEGMLVAPGSKLAFIGCGPVPMSLILMSRSYGIRSVGLDGSSGTVELSKKVIEYLGLENDIEIVHGDGSLLQDLE